MSEQTNDISILRELTKQYLEICAEEVLKERRDSWRRHNSLKPSRTLIYVRAFAWNEMKESRLKTKDSFWHPYEGFLRESIFRHRFNDDFIFEPWLTVKAVYKCTDWGVDVDRIYSDQARGSFKIDYPIKKSEDLSKLRMPWHEIDEQKTSEKLDRVQNALGDLIVINLDRGPAYHMWKGDLSTILGHLRGIENFMMDIVTNSEWLHTMMNFLSEGVLRTHQQAEQAGDWGLSDHQNQAMPYAEELKDPAANVYGVNRKDMWCYAAAQEFTAVSPKHHEEFLLRYQLPILKNFGLIAYGCCEDLTRKIDMLRQIPNLRRIAVSPFADVRKCSEQIGTDYVISYRPSPSDMVSYDLDEDRIQKILKKDFDYLKGTHFDITLKDVETVQCDPNRIAKWVKIAKRVIEEY